MEGKAKQAGTQQQGTSAHDYYRSQSTVSDPGPYAKLFDDLPDDIESVCKIVSGLIVHFFASEHKPAKERLADLETRYVSSILKRIMELDDRPLTEPRHPEKRFVGCCRDFTLLTVAILRHKGIPARARYGTADYFLPFYYMDHVVVEYWTGEAWKMADAQIAPAAHWDFNVRDVPHSRFFVGPKGWTMAQHDGVDPKRFGLGPERGGWNFIFYETVLDLAALNKQEMLPWEGWGIATRNYDDLGTDDKALLDRVAAAALKSDAVEEWRELFADRRLALPGVVQSFSPAFNPADYPVSVVVDLERKRGRQESIEQGGSKKEKESA